MMQRKRLLLLAGVTLLAASAFTAWQFLPAGSGVAASSTGQLLWPATHKTIVTLEQELRRGSADDVHIHNRLGYAYLQSARETGDGELVDKAERAFKKVLAGDPAHLEATTGMGIVYLTRHRFDEAVTWGKRAIALNPHRAFTYGILVDAYIELGAYDDAIETAQKMVDIRPDLASYSRVSYIRELLGDTEGAIEAMEMAVTAGSGNLEHATWCRVYLGHLHFNRGELAAAERQYAIALQQLPYYGHALAGMARVRMTQGRTDEAVSLYERAVEVFPIPEYVIALAESYEAAGQTGQADELFERARRELEAERKGGMDVDEELAELLLDRNEDLDRALALATGAYERRPTVKNADILARAHLRNGNVEEAYRLAQEALRLGTQDANFYQHASEIAARAGRPEEARLHLRRAQEINRLVATPEAAAAVEAGP